MRRRRLGVRGDAPTGTRRRSERPGGVAAELSDELARPARRCIHKVTPADQDVGSSPAASWAAHSWASARATL
jgi:hypothetical protein